MRAAGGCESLVEWFIPGTEPSKDDDWERGGRLSLPAEYAEWASGQGGRWASAAGAGEDRFRIVTPRGGDHYSVPLGVEARYATLSLRASGRTGPVRWSVDGREVRDARWPLAPGPHTIRALAPTGEADEVRITVGRE
jgi:membrane carboxypeptidase/penicillin-binding protein PbpC